MNSKNVKPFSFVNTKVARAVQHGFHALAIDEHRGLFTPTLWEQPNEGSNQKVNLQKLKQCWFPGVHSNIGGSYPDAGISNITLAWMISQLEEHDGGILSFNQDYLDFVQDLNNTFYTTEEKEPIRPWGFGKLYDSSVITNPLSLTQSFKAITRTPGRYNRISLESGTQTDVPLKGTNEYIHRCVRVRMDGGGKGPEENTDDNVLEKAFTLVKKAAGFHPDNTQEGEFYKSPALSKFTLVEPPALKNAKDASGSAAGVYWRGDDGLGDLPEDVLGKTEVRLLKRSVTVFK